MADTKIMFKVGAVDYSNKVIDGYAVQSNPEYTAWNDANGREHRSVIRERVSGSFTLFFKTISDYDSFCLNLRNTMKNDTSNPCVVWDNYKNQEVTSDFFISHTPSRSRGDGAGDEWGDMMGKVKVTIKER